MIPKYPIEEAREDLCRVRFEKWGTGERAGEDLSRYGAFAHGEILRLAVSCPRALGATAVVLRIAHDCGQAQDLPFSFVGCEVDDQTDRFELTLDTAALCGEAGGLFYYNLLLVRSTDTLFSDSINNVDFSLTRGGGRAFRLLIHTADYRVPAWLGEGVMYHVFVDRFCCGAGDVQYRTGERGAELNPDWENGIPQYPDYPGAPLTNHVHFGGNLWGVAEKLDYLASLGVKVIYLSPIFEAYSNHKYDTADYLRVDGGFGGDAAMEHLMKRAKEKGMKIILDGVFNHTGDDSIYFNRYGTYDSVGAYQDEDSPFRTWYTFHRFPDEYEAWWGIDIMPRLNHRRDVECRRYFTGEDGVCAGAIKRFGIDGWRLDVADELSDDFLDELRASVKAADGDAVIIGEVWENAADKIAYGYRRRYFGGRQLDSVMNYPTRTGILAFVRDGDGHALYNVLTELYGSYPRAVSDVLMNLIGTHDTERILTYLGATEEEHSLPNEELAVSRLPEDRRAAALAQLKMAATLQFTVFGIPSVYYGDEVGMEGYHDPFCRSPFPWHEICEGAETAKDYRLDMLAYYRALGSLRESPALRGGDFAVLSHGAHHIAYERTAIRTALDQSDRLVIAANRGDGDLLIPVAGVTEIVLSSGNATLADGILTLAPTTVCVVR